MQRNLALLE